LLHQIVTSNPGYDPSFCSAKGACSHRLSALSSNNQS
jgi:hypothetical protein